jgi:rhomboid protease GluP
MDINNLLLWIVCLSCASTTLYAVRTSARNNLGWIFVAVFILLVTAIFSYLIPAIGGLVGGCLWLILIVLPSIASRKVNQLAAQQRYSQASKVALVVSWLHPADGWREQPQILQALDMGQRGAIALAMEILNRYKTNNTPAGRYATATLYQMDGRWEDLLAWIEENLPFSVLQKDFDMLICYMRSLGEVGDLNGLLEAWERYEPSLDKIPNPMTRNLVLMFIFAFCGRKEQVVRLFISSLGIYSETIQKFWLATADLASGNKILAEEELLSIGDASDIRIRKAVERRLSQPTMIAEEILSDKSQQILSRVTIEFEHEARYSINVSSKPRQPYATYFTIVLNLLVFALEIKSGGSTNFYTLYNLGALVPEEVVAGEWWRVLTATFLHFGFLHLAMNMFGLYIFGRLVEFSLGIPRYLLLYLIAGIGSMLTVTSMSVLGYSQTQFVVGASGCVMGLVGGFAGILLSDWRRQKTHIASKRLRAIFAIILLQAVFDLTTPQISFVGHTSGVILGFLVGSIFKRDNFR